VLRLTRLQDPTRGLTIKVEGQIEGEWGAFLEQECLALRDIATPVSIDLADVHFVDTRGIAALQRLVAAHLALVHCSPLVDELLRTTEPT
jgi:anti-anti-sigma regulatory factor